MSTSASSLHLRDAAAMGPPVRTALAHTLRFVRYGGAPGGLRLAGRRQGHVAFPHRTACQAASTVANDAQTAPCGPTGEAAVTGGGAAAAAAATAGRPYQSQAYPFTEIEAKWQAFWEEHKTFRTPDFHELDTSKPKFYALDMFPYPRCAPSCWVLCCVQAGTRGAALTSLQASFTTPLGALHLLLLQRCRPPRGSPRGVHSHRHCGALQAHARLQRAAPHGLGRVRPAC